MKSITYDEFLELNPCWLDDEEEAAKLEEIGSRRERWSALDILDLDDSEVPSYDKLWAVLREQLIDAPILHEFACRCAERALSRVKNPDPRATAAIAAKRAWMKGEIIDEQLLDAYHAAYYAAYHTADIAAYYAAYHTADYAAYGAAYHAADYAADRAAERAWQIAELKKMLSEQNKI